MIAFTINQRASCTCEQVDRNVLNVHLISSIRLGSLDLRSLCSSWFNLSFGSTFERRKKVKFQFCLRLEQTMFKQSQLLLPLMWLIQKKSQILSKLDKHWVKQQIPWFHLIASWRTLMLDYLLTRFLSSKHLYHVYYQHSSLFSSSLCIVCGNSFEERKLLGLET